MQRHTGDNIGSIRRLWWARCSTLPAYPFADGSVGIAHTNGQGFDNFWQPLYLTEETGRYNFTYSDGEQGLSFSHVVSWQVPKLRPDLVSAALPLFHKKVVLLVEDTNKTLWLIGTRDEHIRLTGEATTAQAYSEYNNATFRAEWNTRHVAIPYAYVLDEGDFDKNDFSPLDFN